MFLFVQRKGKWEVHLYNVHLLFRIACWMRCCRYIVSRTAPTSQLWLCNETLLYCASVCSGQIYVTLGTIGLILFQMLSHFLTQEIKHINPEWASEVSRMKGLSILRFYEGNGFSMFNVHACCWQHKKLNLKVPVLLVP